MGGGEITPHDAAMTRSAKDATQVLLCWEEMTTPSRQPHFANHKIQATSFDGPGLPAGAKQTPRHKAISLDGNPLPAGWESRCILNADGSEGRLYFVNHNKKENSWDDPRLT
jgi:hypothetical protein